MLAFFRLMLAFFRFPSSAKNDDFRYLEGTFKHFLAPWSTIWLTWGAQGAPWKTPGGPDLDFLGFWVDLGNLLEPYFSLILVTVRDFVDQTCGLRRQVVFSVIWGEYIAEM